jgi:SAM-dependent methyltransferase
MQPQDPEPEVDLRCRCGLHGRVSERSDHWERIYATRPAAEVSWYESEPTTSLRLIEARASGPSTAVIDVGGGASSLVDRLLADGFTDLAVLDISQRALDEVRERLGEQARHVRFILDDVLTWEPDRRYDVWHDRAVFHFLTESTARDRYVDLAGRAIRRDGALVLGTFADDGPTQCSGLPVCRYSPPHLAQAFSTNFTLVEHERDEHVTPGGVIQPFTWVVLRRT